MSENNNKIGTITATVEVDTTQAVAALKALQREARKTVQALKAVEDVTPSRQVFQNGDLIEWEGRLVRCISADPQTAVFALAERYDCGIRVSYNNMFAVSNDPALLDVIEGKFKRIA